MPQRLIWTDRHDAALLRLRSAGCSWDAIGGTLRVSRNAVIERGRRLGARLPRRILEQQEREDPERAPLPAGHPVSWQVLVGGTLLAEEKYPAAEPIGRRYSLAIG